MGWIIAFALALLASASWPHPVTAGDAPASGTDPSGPSGRAPLAEAVRSTPLGTRTILFTDWASIRAATGHEAVTSSSPVDIRIEAMLEMTETIGPLASFAIAHLPTHADVWGWDSTDLDWEASFVVDGPPVTVLRFREDFDLAPVRGAYEERGFAAASHGAATILSHEMDLGTEWIRGSDFGVLNTAFLDDGHTLVLSSDVDGVQKALDAMSVDTARASAAELIADTLGSPLTAGIEVGPDGCIAYDPLWLPGSDGGPNEELLKAAGALNAWEGLGMGIDGANGGRFVLAFATPEAAASDFDRRVRLAEQGVSLMSGELYADHVFRVLDAAVDGPVIRLDVEPVDGRADRLSQALITRDLLFAACG